MRERNELILADLIQLRAEQNPDLDVLTFEHQSLDGGETADEVRTYADLHENANRLAAGMQARGIECGDRVAVMLRNHPEFVEIAIACGILGALIVPIDPRTRRDKLGFMLRKAGCRGIVCAAEAIAQLPEDAAVAPQLEWVWLIDAAAVPARLRSDPIRETLEKAVPTVDVCVDSPDAPLQIMFTSGTTGDPKGIVGDNARFCSAGILGLIFGYQPDDRPYTGLSLTHGNAQSVTLMPALNLGLRAVFSRRFTKSKLWDVVRHHGCTTFSLVGGMATAIYSEPARPNDADNPVRMVVSGGMPRAIWEPFERRFDLRVLEFYGAMDGGGMAFKPIGEGPVGSFGKPMPNIQMKILDEAGHESPPGVVGEICCRPQDGGDATIEYFADDEASRRKIRAGWNRSGDMGHTDADGWLFFDYRAGGGLRHNGDFIDPSQVERVIAECPSVADVFVYGIPAASGAPGEKDVVAAVVFVPEEGGSPAALRRYCGDHLEGNSVPSHFQVVDEIPKTASEKPQERLLRERLEDDGEAAGMRSTDVGARPAR
ncbi:MAG: AMP-binding protein [Deltaproteobacteria bacterium]|nr:AMP-binding protein [Deltaproteobacteria bacterium]